MTYLTETKYIASLNTADAEKLAQHGNPKLRNHVAPILMEMANRHAHNNYTTGLDAKSCDDIMYYSSAAEIRQALRSKEQAK